LLSNRAVIRRETMQRAPLVALLIATIFATTAFAFNPDELERITFVNTTRTTIEMILVSPGDSRFWGPDIIGADYILKNGASISYYMHCPDKSLTFDVLATDDRGNKLEIRNVTLADGNESKVALTAKGMTRAPNYTPVAVRIDNSSGHEMQYLFVSPSDSAAWGVDLLDDETTLPQGGSYSFVLVVGREKVRYNVMGVDENNAEYQFAITIDPRARKEFAWAIEPGDRKKSK
jgi:hypothetical protein